MKTLKGMALSMLGLVAATWLGDRILRASRNGHLAVCVGS